MVSLNAEILKNVIVQIDVADLKTQFKRRTFHVPNQMQISLNKGFCLLTLDSAHEKFDVWTGSKVPDNVHRHLMVFYTFGFNRCVV